MRKQKVLMTGVTGVLGSAIFAGLEDVYDVYYLVRDGIYNHKLFIEIEHNKVYNSDVTKEFCGLSSFDIQQLKEIGIDKFLHVAANVSFEIKDDKGKIWDDNYNGTFNAIALAKELGVEEFLFCSTAFAEDSRNPYEQSKLSAELLVKRCGLKYSIFRPSAIVGDSKTGYTPRYNGYYGAFAWLSTISKRFPDCFNIYVMCDESSTLNLISIDWISYTIIHLITSGAKNKIYYLAHDRPMSAKWIIEKTFEILNISGVRYINPVNDLRSNSGYDDIIMKKHINNPQVARVQKIVNPVLEKYHPYITFERKFSLESVKNELGVNFISPPSIDENFLKTILKYAVEHNFGYDRPKQAA